MVKVAIVDDQDLLRAGFRKLLESELDIDVCGEARDGSEAVEIADRLNPDVVLMDIRMPRMDGIEATRRITQRHRETRVVMLTTYDLDEYVFEALKAGASGFLLKDCPPDQLISGIRAVATGDALLAPSITRRLIDEFSARPQAHEAPELQRLSERETEVLMKMAEGLSNSEIASQLIRGEATVKSHVRSILAKLGLRDRVQAVVFAYESGLVAPGSRSPER